MARFKVEIDVNQIEGLADRLASVESGAALGAAMVSAVNTTATAAYATARRKMTSGINLTDDYVQQRMALEPATSAQRPVATVVARFQPTNLTRYGATQLTQPVRWPNALIANKVGKMGLNPRKPGALLKWKERTGDRSRGIPVDMKEAGIQVEVTRGSPKPISYAFVLRGKNGNLLIAKRVAGTRRKIKVLYGPSVYQLFRAALSTEFLSQVADDLAKNTLTLTSEELVKALT